MSVPEKSRFPCTGSSHVATCLMMLLLAGQLAFPGCMDAGMAIDFAERILNGENPENMKPVVEPPRYAFALERFHIPETRLLAGSAVLFREPTAWERYRLYILGAIFFLLMETALVAMLLFERRRTKQAKSLLERRFSIERIIAECSTRLSECPADKVDQEIERGLRTLLESEGVDRASWFVMDDSGVGVRNAHSVNLPGVSPEPTFYNRPELPWITEKLLNGQSVVVARLNDLPPEAQADRSYLEQRYAKSLAFVPVRQAAARGVLVLVRLAEPGEWPAALTDRLEVLGNIFANALMRKQAQEARQESEERFRYLFTEAPIGIALEDLDGRVLFANPALCSMLGYTQEELTSMNCSQFADPEDQQEDWKEFQAMRAGARRSYQLEKRYRRKDGGRMWGRLNVSTLNSSGRPTLVLATVEDITPEINLTLDQVPQSLSEEVSLCFYRVAQEALMNAVKHSRSARVDVTVVASGRVLRMRIRDFGVGFDPAVPKDGLGLVTMQERLKMIGGVLRFHSVPGKGAELEAEANIGDASLSAQAA